jgi:hypothetical protein
MLVRASAIDQLACNQGRTCYRPMTTERMARFIDSLSTAFPLWSVA